MFHDKVEENDLQEKRKLKNMKGLEQVNWPVNDDSCLDIFAKNNFGKFNSTFGKYVKEDSEFYSKWIGANINARPPELIESGAFQLRAKFQSMPDENSRSELVPKIINEEFQNGPAPTPSYKAFLNDVARHQDTEQYLNSYLTLKDLNGYDLYLLKQLFFANKKHNEKKGISLPKQFNNRLRELQNQEVFMMNDEPQNFGGGKYHSVYKAKVMQGNNEPEEVIWKSIATDTQVKQGACSTAKLSGIGGDYEHESKLSERSVLTRILDKFLFPQNSVCAETKFAHSLPGSFNKKNPGASGVIMGVADGKPIALKEVTFNLNAPQNYTKNRNAFKKLNDYRHIEQTYEQFIYLVKNSEDSFINNLYPDLQFSIDAEILKIKDVKSKFRDENAMRTALEGSIRLGILDYISGQTDRHYENYYVTDEGKVIAIDNDMSFGTNVGARKQKNGARIIPNNGSLLTDSPRVITNDIKKEIENFAKSGFGPFLNELQKVFPEDSMEYKGVAGRALNILGLCSDKSVIKKDDLLSPAALNLINTENNYIARDLLVHSSDVFGPVKGSGWNPFRVNRNAKKFGNNVNHFIK